MNIAALAIRALNKAWGLIADQLTACTVRDVPTFMRETTTGTDIVSDWAVEVSTDADGASMRAFFYEKAQREQSSEGPSSGDILRVPSTVQMAVLRRSDLPGVDALSTAAELVVDAVVWKVSAVSMPPGGAVFILTLQAQ